MSNSERGEFGLTLGGRQLKFKMGTSALIEFQEVFAAKGTSPPTIPELMRHVIDNRLKYVRAFLWAGLQRYHPDIGIEDVSTLLDEADPAEITALIGNLGGSTVPDPHDMAAIGGKANPPKAQARTKAGTGARSTSKRDG